jgi:amino acid adenylation domain-containing protein
MHVCKEEQCTVFMILLTTLALLFHRYTGDEDIIIGAPSAGRRRQEWEGLIGCFLNTLALRIDLSGRPTFRQLLRRVREVTLNAQVHEEIPFEKLLEELKVERDLSRPPLFQVFLNMHEFADDTLSISGLNVTPFPKIHHRALFDLTLYFKEIDHRIHLALNYNVALFSQSRIEAILGQLHGILEEATASLDLPLRRYSLISSHSGQLLPDPQIPLHKPLQEHVLELIRQQAETLPGHTAIRHEGRTWLYQELINQTETMAKDLCARGLQSGDVVAIGGMRSFGMIVALLGVLRAGGIIMPLDSRLPTFRQRLMRQEGQAKRFLWIGEEGPQEFDDKMEPNIEIIIIDPTNGDTFDGRPFREDSAIHSLPQPDDAAYMFFTSGSTGKPKGILGSHQALSHFLSWQRETFAISPDDRVAQCTGLSFDAVLRDIFLPLTSGATLCLPPEEAGSNELLMWLAEEHITAVHVVPSVASFWLASISEPIRLPSLRWVFFAGEPLTDQILAQWEAACPGPAQFVNLYGATEATLVKSWYLVPAERMKGVQPIGRPLPQTQLLVMGDEHRLCGIGEVGELIIRTPFRSLGYLQANDDTPPRFVPNPYRDDPTDVLYHTGDLGRYRLDGTVEILGRRDDQVKIRGVRVEPQEVAAVLSTCPEVQMCTVLASRDNQDEIALTAFVVPQPDTSLSGSAMRTYLSARIPSALVPSQYVRLDQFPLTPNGKIDRQALRRLTPTETTKEPYVAPRTPLEEAVASIFQDVLGLEQVGVHDNFFDLGGHSLLATQALARIRKTFEGKLTLRDFFAIPTVAVLAEWIATLQGNITRASRTGKTPSGNRQRGRL